MDIDIVYQNRLWAQPDDLDAVVVIDVLRSFTTAAWAIHSGARSIYPAAGPAAAFALWRRRPHAILVGALGGGRPVPGFDYGNSPSEIASAPLIGQDIILSTAAGVQGLLRYASVPLVLGGSLCNAKATAARLLEAKPRRIGLVITGEWIDRDGDEDVACADYLHALLTGRPITPAEIEARVRHSDFGRQFGATDAPHLSASDLAHCATCDRFSFSLRLDRDPIIGDIRLIAEEQSWSDKLGEITPVSA